MANRASALPVVLIGVLSVVSLLPAHSIAETAASRSSQQIRR